MRGAILNWDGTIMTRLHDDPSNNKMHIQYTQDCTDILKANHDARQNPNRGYSASRDMRHIASIPFGRIYEWMQQYGVSYDIATSQEFISKRLREQENAALRTVDRI